MSPEGKVSGNGRKEKRMGGIGIGKKDGRGWDWKEEVKEAVAFAKRQADSLATQAL